MMRSDTYSSFGVKLSIVVEGRHRAPNPERSGRTELVAGPILRLTYICILVSSTKSSGQEIKSDRIVVTRANQAVPRRSSCGPLRPGPGRGPPDGARLCV